MYCSQVGLLTDARKTPQSERAVTLDKKTEGISSMEQVGAGWRKRLAVQIAAQLPEGTDDALMVLEYTKELVVRFLADQTNGYPQQIMVNDQRRAFAVVSDSNSPNLRAISKGSPSGLPK